MGDFEGSMLIFQGVIKDDFQILTGISFQWVKTIAFTFQNFEPLLGQILRREDLKFVAATRVKLVGKRDIMSVFLGGDVTPSADLKKGRSTLFQVIYGYIKIAEIWCKIFFYDWILTMCYCNN